MSSTLLEPLYKEKRQWSRLFANLGLKLALEIGCWGLVVHSFARHVATLPCTSRNIPFIVFSQTVIMREIYLSTEWWWITFLRVRFFQKKESESNEEEKR
jgi:hypothetical protein